MSPKDALVLRGGEAGLLFRSEVESALRRFNPWTTDDAIRSAVENLLALPPTIERNRQMLAWLRGERQWYEGGEKSFLDRSPKQPTPSLSRGEGHAFAEGRVSRRRNPTPDWHRVPDYASLIRPTWD